MYISASIFTGTVRKELGINYIRTSKNLPILSGSGKALLFDLEKGTVSDGEGTNYYPVAIQRGDEVFVAVSLVTLFFNLNYSQQKVPRGRLVQIYNDKAGLTGKSFADAAIYPMEVRYSEYLRSKEPAQETPDPEPEDPVQTEEPVRERTSICAYVPLRAKRWRRCWMNWTERETRRPFSARRNSWPRKGICCGG